ncbi:MAG: hypothetical protein Q7U04_00055 [Bacteriovorax sp.]|nr:hypothetical protein [Bacteriovorax sp.]
MQGLPSQILPKSSKAQGLGDKKATAKTEADGASNGAASEVSGKGKEGVFASLLSNLTGKDKAEGKASEVQSETGEILKNLLAEKNKENSEGKVEDQKDKNIEAKAGLSLLVENSELGKGKAEKNIIEKKSDSVDQKLAKTSSNLDQLLNTLKGNSDFKETNDAEDNNESDAQNSLESLRTKKSIQPAKLNSKSESTLDFLINGTKEKNVGENAAPISLKLISKESEISSPHAKVMTGEDYIKNMISSEKAAPNKLASLNNLMDLQKNNPQNVKGYGQGLSLLSDPLIKNTKDLASKESGKKSIDELRNPETKVGAELAVIKQDMMPEIQNNKNGHGQPAETQTQANQKVLDLGSLNTANTTEIIKRISDYVEQNQVANKASLDLTVKHETLGEFKIQVTKMPSQSINQGQNLIDMQITTSNKEGHDFFVKNEVSLMKNLNQAGVNLSDFRIISTMAESTSFGQSDSKQSSSFSQNQEGSEKQFMSFNSSNFRSDTNSGSERRKELWEEYQQRYGA